MTKLIVRNFVKSLTRKKNVGSGACTASMQVSLHRIAEFTPILLVGSAAFAAVSSISRDNLSRVHNFDPIGQVVSRRSSQWPINLS